MILHTLNSPVALDKAGGLIGPEDEVLLLEDGVYLALNELPFTPLVIESDAVARGIRNRIRGGQLAGYADFVAAAARADKVCAWF